MRENKAPGTKLSHMFCEGFGPLQLGLVLVLLFFRIRPYLFILLDYFCPTKTIKNDKVNKHNAELQRADPGTKITE